MARHNKTGRSKTAARFVMIEEYILRSDAWRDATLYARCALIELMRRYNGKNNGSIAISIRDLAGLLSCQKSRAARALLELEELGFIETKRIGGFAVRNRKASEYLLTMHRCDLTGHVPVKAFMQHASSRSLSTNVDNTVHPRGLAKDNYPRRSTTVDNENAKPRQTATALCPPQRTHLYINHTPTEQTSAQVETDPFADLELPAELDRRSELLEAIQ